VCFGDLVGHAYVPEFKESRRSRLLGCHGGRIHHLRVRPPEKTTAEVEYKKTDFSVGFLEVDALLI